MFQWPLVELSALLRHAVAPRVGSPRLLRVDDTDPAVRGLIQATLDLARGLALADVLTDDSRRRARVVRAWSDQLAAALAPRG